MKKIILSFLAITISLLVFAQEKTRIAVFDPASTGTSIDEGTKIAVREIISSTIVNTGNYSIVERSLLEKVMEEQRFSNSGAVDDMQATEIGKLAGANKVVISVITMTGGRNMISIKIIDVMTATVDRQKVKVVTSGELLDVVEPLTLDMLRVKSSTASSVSHSNNSPTTSNLNYRTTQYVPNGEFIMYGVDFSKVQIYGSYENAQQYAYAFVEINAIFNKEPKKYNFSKLTGKEVVVYTQPTDELINSIDWGYAMNSNGSVLKHNINDIIHRYQLPHSEGIGMVIIAWLLDKTHKRATHEVVLFDIKTRKIIFNTTATAEAGGASLRNFWANSIYNLTTQKEIRNKMKVSLNL